MMSNSIIGQCNDRSDGRSNSMHDNGPGTTGGTGTLVAVSGALSFMGCVRETSSSPPPYRHHRPHHHHHRHNNDSLAMEDFSDQRGHNILVKEPKKRRFHPLRGLRRIFRRKSRSTVDPRTNIHSDHDGDATMGNNAELTMGYSTGRVEGIRSKSASELLTDLCDRQSIFLSHHGMDEPFPKLRNASGQLSVSHDSIFPGEVHYTRPLSSLDALNSPESQQVNMSDMCVKSNHTSYDCCNHRMSFEVLEQMKTSTEESRRNGMNHKSVEFSHVPYTVPGCYQPETENFLNRGFKPVKREDSRREEKKEDIKQRWRTLHQDDVDERAVDSTTDLPEFASSSLNHTAALHRISVRPKNRRPPRRSVTAIQNVTTTMTAAIIGSIPKNADRMQSIDLSVSDINSQNEKIISKPESTSLTRTSTIHDSTTSDVFDQLTTRLNEISASTDSLSPDSLDMSADKSQINEGRHIEGVAREPSDCSLESSRNELELLKLPINRTISILDKNTESPDNNVNAFSKSSESFDHLIEDTQVPLAFRRHMNYISKSSDGFATLSTQSDVKPVSKRLASKSSEAVDNFERSLDSMTKEHSHSDYDTNINQAASIFDNTHTADTLFIRDDLIEHRRGGFDILPRKNVKVISVSSENFSALEKSQFKKRSSVADIYLSSTPHHSRMTNKLISKSTESFDSMATNSNENRIDTITTDKYSWRKSPREIDSMKFESSRLDECEGNRIVRKTSKKVQSPNMIDILSENSIYKNGRKQSSTMNQPPHLHKSLGSSEVDNTQAPMVNRRRGMTGNVDDVDSLEGNLDNNGKTDLCHKNETNSITVSKGDSNDSDANCVNYEHKDDNVGHSIPLMHADQYYWRQRSDSKENIDIHQLLAITIVSRITDNTNNRNSVAFSKNSLASIPTSPIVKQEGNKLLLNNLLGNKNNEELQNMLNGNISEVSTDTKSFKEKLIMFEKLGK